MTFFKVVDLTFTGTSVATSPRSALKEEKGRENEEAGEEKEERRGLVTEGKGA